MELLNQIGVKYGEHLKAPRSPFYLQQYKVLVYNIVHYAGGYQYVCFDAYRPSRPCGGDRVLGLAAFCLVRARVDRGHARVFRGTDCCSAVDAERSLGNLKLFRLRR